MLDEPTVGCLPHQGPQCDARNWARICGTYGKMEILSMSASRSNGSNGHTYTTTNDFEEMIDAWTALVSSYLDEGWDAYLVSILFHEMPGSRQAKKAQMNQAVERIYNRLATRMVRKPRSGGWVGSMRYLPMGIFLPDFPVPKLRNKAKSAIEDVCINDGMHMGGILLGNRWGRIRYSLTRHFSQKRDLYESGTVRSIGVKRITHDLDRAVDYTFKSLKRRTSTPDDVLVLNWGRSALAMRRWIMRAMTS
jgi:hypothetical protein